MTDMRISGYQMLISQGPKMSQEVKLLVKGEFRSCSSDLFSQRTCLFGGLIPETGHGEIEILDDGIGS